jgi:hypothetical protein
MARTINEIQNGIIASFQEKSGLTLSSSKVAEWRLWTYIFAVAIHTFEIILDSFKSEIDVITNKITPGTARWYAEMCYRFQNGHELLFDESNAKLYYSIDDPDSRIVKVVAIKEDKNKLVIKAAKQNNEGKIIPLSLEEKYNFTSYVDAVKFAGVDTSVVSTSEDKIRYNIEVYFETSIPNTLVHENILKALDIFKAGIGFDSMIYKQRFIDAVMDAQGVITCNLISLERKGATDEGFVTIGIYSELESGYFEYDTDSIVTLKTIKELEP